MEFLLASRIGYACLKSFTHPVNPPAEHNAGVEAEHIDQIKTAQITRVTELDAETFELLCLAEQAIHYTRCVLSKGSGNQLEHLGGNWDEITNHDNIYLHPLATIGMEKIRRSLGRELPGAVNNGIFAGVAQYYGGENCAGYTAVVTNYLCEHAPIGTIINYYRVNTKDVMRGDHYFASIEYGGKEVVCDAYPANNPQAVLTEDYFIPQQAMTLEHQLTVTKHVNFMKDFYIEWTERFNIDEFLIPMESLTFWQREKIKEGYKEFVFQGIACTKDGQVHDYHTTLPGHAVQRLSDFRELVRSRPVVVEDLRRPAFDCVIF